MRRRLGDLLACLVLVALAWGCFARLVARPGALIADGVRPSIDYTMVNDPRGVGNDLTFLFLPHYQTITAQMDRTRRLPFWDGSGFAGRPMIGNPQGGLFYPPVWLAWACRSPAALGWLTVGHLLWAGVGAYVLGRGLGMGRVAATLAGGCFEASPYILAQTLEGHYPHVWAAAWYPWAFWAFTEFKAARLRGAFALPPILALVFLTGHPQEWYYLVFALSAWAGLDAARSVWLRKNRQAVAKLVAWTAVVALSFGLTALELVPDAAAQANTLRSGRLKLGQASSYTLHSENLLQLLNPFALGGPTDYIGRDNYWEQVLSVGLVPLALALIAVTRHPNRKLVTGWLTLTVVATIFACGRRMMLFSFFYHWVPGINRFRVPSRALFLAYVGTAVLAGLGVEALRSGVLSAVSWRAWHKVALRVVAGLLAALLVCQGCAWSFDAFEPARPKSSKPRIAATAAPRKGEKARPPALKPDDDDHETEPYRFLLATSRIVRDVRFWLFLGGTALALTYGSRVGHRRAMGCALSALALVELGMYGHALIRVAPVEPLVALDPVSAALARARPPFDGPFRIRARDTYYNDLHASEHGFEKININDWFQIQRAADLYQTLYPLFEQIPPPTPRDPMAGALRQFGQDVRRAVLDRLCVAFLISDHVDLAEPWPIEATGHWKGKTFAVHRNPTVLPRAYVVPRAHPAPENAPRELALFRRIDPRSAVLMSMDPLPTATPRQSYTPAEWVPTDSDRVVVRVKTEAPGLLVVADTWTPGWTARVDGKLATIYRGNHAQRVVPLAEAGEHLVEMTYTPPGLYRGAALSALSAFLWLAALLGARRLRARRDGAPIRVPTVAELRPLFPAPHFCFRREKVEGGGSA